MPGNSLLLELVEAAQKLREDEKSALDSRKSVARLLAEAAKNHQVTTLSQLTGINRTTIYWYINTWSNNENGNGINRRKAS